MEKFSAYRDPGTGIQPFLTPVPPLETDFLANITLPLRYVIATARTLLVLVLALLYIFLVDGFCLMLTPIPPLYRGVTHIITYALGRTVLLLVGLYWIPIETVTRKKGRAAKVLESWNPRAGDIIVSNWVSWIELVWLAVRYNPMFLRPVIEEFPSLLPSSQRSDPIVHTPGRRTGVGSAGIQSPSKAPVARIPIVGFREISLLQIIGLTGYVPQRLLSDSNPVHTLEELRNKATRPVVVFPECTTSNGRGLLRFSDVFHQNVPVKKYQVFVMCVRYDPPTSLAPTLTRSLPSTIMNPLSHVFTLTTALSPLKISIRLLIPSESPSSQLFMANEFISGHVGEDQLAESCASLIAQMGKMKRTGMGWEDKATFLELYRGKNKSSR